MFSHQKIGGVSKYFAKLLRYLPPDSWVTSTIFSENQYVKDMNLFPVIKLPGSEFRGKARLRLELGIPYTLLQLSRKRYDVYHQTHYELFSLLGIGDKPMVTTIHDMNFFTSNVNKRLQYDIVKSCKRADRIIAISESTKKDLINMLAVDENKISVIYHGIDHIDLETVPHPRLFDYPYILYVGNRQNSFKNFEKFIKAFSLLAEKNREIRLVCTGAPFTEQERGLFETLKIRDKCCSLLASETQMYQLYRDALFFVYPSLSEGFGMPILEAMQCGCPNVLANASCFPEIAQNAAEYFDPQSVDSMYETMNRVYLDESIRNKIVEIGFRRVLDFSWEKTAAQHYSLYQSLV